MTERKLGRPTPIAPPSTRPEVPAQPQTTPAPEPPAAATPPERKWRIVNPKTPFRETGDTTLSDFAAAIRRSFKGSASPMSGEAEEVFRAAKGLSRLCSAVAWHETKNHSWNCMTAPPPCVPLECKNPYAIRGNGPKGWRQYRSYAEATSDWVRLLLDPRGPYKDAITIEELIAIYAPSFENDTKRYAGVICDEINRLPLGIGTPDIERWPANTDPLAVIAGGAPYTDDYGFLDDIGLPYYGYIVGHGGTRATQHPGIDLCAPYGTPIYMPVPGKVVCRGEAGTPMWNQGCGFYNDYGDASAGRTYGIGNLTFLLEGGQTKLTIGHVRECYVALGEWVAAGRLIGTVGGMNGAHIHIETAINERGSYWITEPRERLRLEMSKHPPVPRPNVTPAPRANPFRKPAIHTLVSDYWKYGLDRQAASRVLANRFDHRNGGSIMGIVWHVQQGTTLSSLAWWGTPGVEASSNVIVNRDGSILRVIEDQHAAYCNGDVRSPSERGRELIARAGGRNLNCVTVSLEAEGYSTENHPQQQLESICWMTAEWLRRHELGLRDVYRHADINGDTRAHCPGSYYDTALRMLREGGL